MRILLLASLVFLTVAVVLIAVSNTSVMGHADRHSDCAFGWTTHGLFTHRHFEERGRHYAVACDASEATDYRQTAPEIPPGRTPVETSFTAEQAVQALAPVVSAKAKSDAGIIWLLAGRHGEADTEEQAWTDGRADRQDFIKRYTNYRELSEVKVKRIHITWSYDRPDGYYKWQWSYTYLAPVRLKPTPTPTATPSPKPTPTPVAIVPTMRPPEKPTPVPIAELEPTETPRPYMPSPTATPVTSTHYCNSSNYGPTCYWVDGEIVGECIGQGTSCTDPSGRRPYPNE